MAIRSPRTVQQRHPAESRIMSSSDGLDEQVIEADLAEFVDDHDGVVQRRILNQPVQQRRLSGTEKTRQDRERNGRRGAGRTIGHRAQSVEARGAARGRSNRILAMMAASTRAPPIIWIGVSVSPSTKVEAHGRNDRLDAIGDSGRDR